MAKGIREKIKLESTAGTGHFYTTTKNKRNTPEKMLIKKFDPVARKHVEYKETKLKSSAGSRIGQVRRNAPASPCLEVAPDVSRPALVAGLFFGPPAAALPPARPYNGRFAQPTEFARTCWNTVPMTSRRPPSPTG